jgi:hypothetical protein
VTGTAAVCSAAALVPATVTVDIPTVPTVSQSGNTITSTPAIGYQWIFNSTALTGDTAQSYTISQTGNYMVVTRDANGCYASSLAYIFTYVDGITGISSDMGVKLYPVPNQGSFVVEASGLSGADLAIYDIYGQELYSQKLNADKTQISGVNLASAIYFVTVSIIVRQNEKPLPKLL